MTRASQSVDLHLNAIPAPFSYNPSAWSQRVPVAIIATFGFLLATYMGLYQWRLIGDVWDPVFGDQTKAVLDSDLSHMMRRWMRLPDASFGALAYLGDIIFALAGSTRRWQFRPWMVVIFGIDVIPLGIVSAILVFCQGAIVGAWCFLCLVTAVISLTLIYFAYDEVGVCLIFLYRVWKRSRSVSVLARTFCGLPNDTAHEVAMEMTGEHR